MNDYQIKRLQELREQEGKLRYDTFMDVEGASDALCENLQAQHEILIVDDGDNY